MLNFSEYLRRLGFKTGHQPVLLDTVQPVLLVADLQALVSKPKLSSYLVGANEAPTVGTFSAVQVRSSVPLHLREITLGMSTTSPIAITIGTGAPPTQSNPIIITPQLFDATQVPKALWRTGDDVVGVANGIPTVRAGTTSLIIIHELWVPAGGWLEFRCANITNTMSWTCVVDEYPGETPN